MKRYSLAASIAALVLLTITFALFLRNQELRRQLSGSRTEAAELREENEAAQKELDQERSLKESSARQLENERNKRIEAEGRAPKVVPPDSQDAPLDFLRIRLGVAFIPRGGGMTRTIRVPEHARWLRFEIPIKRYPEVDSYRISINPVGRGAVVEKASLKASRSPAMVVADVAADKLRPGDYVLALYGEKASAEPVLLGEYPFRIEN